MQQKKILSKYKRSLQDLKTYSQKIGMSENDFQIFFSDCIKELPSSQFSYKTKTKDHYLNNRCLHIVCRIGLFIFIMLTVNILLQEKPLNWFFCKIQEFIYPGLRLLRILSIPIISTFPSLTELYDETCLLQNPFFRITDMDCWPCKDVYKIKLYDPKYFDPNSSPPFLYKTDQREISIGDLKKIYEENKKVFDIDAPKMTVNQRTQMLASKFFITHDRNTEFNKNTGNSYIWRMNRMFPAHLIRRLFPRPDVIPRLGLSTERFITIDEHGSLPYKIPDSECNFIFIIQSQGERLIKMEPSAECTSQCNAVSVLLSPSYLLWYNWWYWRPVSYHISNSTSISYIGSYC